MNFRHSVILILSLSTACGSDDNVQPPEAVDCTTLTQTVPASPWAQTISPARSYRYTGGIADNEISVEVLGDNDAVLGTLKVSQILDGDDLGTMVAELSRDGEETLTMSTKGNVGIDGFSVRSTLDNGDQKVDVLSRFENTACAEPVEDRPTCVGILPVNEPEFTVGSCGLTWDSARAYGRQPRLASVRYLSQNSATSGGVISAQSSTYFVDVVSQGDVTPASDIQVWLQESGADAIVGSEDEQLLTTVYNDSAWKDAFLAQVQSCENAPTVATQALCAAPLTTRGQSLGTCGTSSRRDEGAWGQSDKLPSGTPCNGGCVEGDPHFVSFDGHAFDFQGVGEYILAEASTGDSFSVQARLTPVESRTFAVCRTVSATSAVAFEWSGKRVAIYNDRDPHLWVDGAPVANLAELDREAGFTSEISNKTFVFGWPGGERVKFKSGIYPDIFVDLPSSRLGQIKGLLGTFNAQTSDEFTPRDSASLTSPVSKDQLYRVFGDSWRVTAFESLFDYEVGESTQTFTDFDFPPTQVDDSDVPADAREKAAAACKSAGVVDPWLFQGCVLDAICAVGVTSLTDVASPALVTQIGDVSWTMDGMVRPAGTLAEVNDASQGTACVEDLVAVVWVSEEAKRIELSQALTVQTADGTATVAVGESVYSYWLSFDPKTATSALPAIGSVTFSSPILGIITSSEALASSDSAFGSGRSVSDADGLESNDLAHISPDGRRLELNLKHGNDVDHVRVIVAAPQENQ